MKEFPQKKKPKHLNSSLIMKLKYYSFNLQDQCSDFDMGSLCCIGLIDKKQPSPAQPHSNLTF